ncbi:uncharacterized protein LOC130998688 [Salvia miltiorrhiza]|uniref:uncharacterized protein LOC130998688 n=1 Tax=Salvia miltiorrhiza TaxID=226208 RepID=UPI0025AC54ED|nr:uncharacterized protein LOC130998688 [Salvia miltiorrhiza]
MDEDFQEELVEPSMEETIISQHDRANGAPKRKVRGVTKGLSLQKKCQRTPKLDVIIHPTRNRIVGENAKDFKTEACVMVKQFAQVQHPRWKDIPMENKRKMWIGMKQKFNLEEDVHVKKVVFHQFNRQYRSYRHKLHMHYLENKGERTILDKSPHGVNREDWKLLIDYFESDAFKKISGRNKENRQKLTMNHSCGTKSIAQACYEERDPETGEEPTRTAASRKSRYNNEKKQWVDDASKEVYEKLIMCQSLPEDGGEPMTEDEAFIKVLGEEKSSRLRGCGDGIKPTSKRGERINLDLQKENEELRKQNQELTARFESLEAQVSNNEVNLQTQVEAVLRMQLPGLMQSLSQNSETPNSN